MADEQIHKWLEDILQNVHVQGWDESDITAIEELIAHGETQDWLDRFERVYTPVLSPSTQRMLQVMSLRSRARQARSLRPVEGLEQPPVSDAPQALELGLIPFNLPPCEKPEPAT